MTDRDELVRRLRKRPMLTGNIAPLMDEAADRIEADGKLIAEMREALVDARDEAHSLAHDRYDGVWDEADFALLTPKADAILARLDAEAQR